MSVETSPIRVGGGRICDYRLHSWLKTEHTALCVSLAGRPLVLKRLPEECLQASQLHAGVRERLMRIRQLAHRQVATFLGVERDPDGQTYLVWEYVQGDPLEKYLADPNRSPREVLLMLRELILAAEGLHALGIVHGALYPRNVIITHLGELKLTHISPLLHHDPATDYNAVAELLQRVIRARGEDQTPLGKLVAAKIAAGAPMLELAGEIGRLVDVREAGRAEHVEDPSLERQVRRKALYAAIGCAAGALVLALAVYLLLIRKVDAPERPPEAPAELLQPR